jgi:hypothetical protein
MLRTAVVDISCFENNFSQIDFWLQKVEKTIPFLNLKKNDEKIFLNFRLFFDASMNNTQEKLVKTISDVKKMLLTRFFITKPVSCCMVLKWLSDAILIMKNVFLTKTFDAELMFRTAAVHLSCYENKFSEIDFWLQKVEKTIPFLNFMKNDGKIFFDFRLFSCADMNNMQEKLYPTWRKCFKRDYSSQNMLAVVWF